MKLQNDITYKPFGAKAILLEWDAKIDEVILNEISSFKQKLISQNDTKFQDFVVGYQSLTIIYKDFIANFDSEVIRLENIRKSNIEFEKVDNFLWKIPVWYDLEFGIDLQEISTKNKLTISEIVDLHSSKIYTVCFIGFLPGFLYLAGLDEKLFINRKENPRLKVEKGSVAIGGKQTGIYPQTSAGGWQIIGRSPIPFFDATKNPPCFAESGDKIQFAPVSREEFFEIENQIKENQYLISKTKLND